MDYSDLVTFRSYAEINGKTTQWVYEQEKNGSINVVIIDGKKFVKLDKK